MIVGCDGPHSKVAKLNGVKHNYIYGMQVRTFYDISMSITELHFDPDWKELFGWVIPEEREGEKIICRVGMGALYNPGPNFKRFLGKLGIKPEMIKNKQGGIIPFGYITRIGFDRAILLGDSACMVKATTGGGIVMLLSAAKIARSAILKAIEMNDFSERFFVKYYENNREMIKLRIELKIHFFIRLILKRLTAWDFNWFFSLYETTNIKHIIQSYADMDFPKRVIIKLFLNRNFDRFLVHFLARNLKIIPEIIRLLVGKKKKNKRFLSE